MEVNNDGAPIDRLPQLLNRYRRVWDMRVQLNIAETPSAHIWLVPGILFFRLESIPPVPCSCQGRHQEAGPSMPTALRHSTAQHSTAGVHEQLVTLDFNSPSLIQADPMS